MQANDKKLVRFPLRGAADDDVSELLQTFP